MILTFCLILKFQISLNMKPAYRVKIMGNIIDHTTKTLNSKLIYNN